MRLAEPGESARSAAGLRGARPGRVTRPVRAAILLVAAVGTLALGGCRGGAAAAPSGGGAASPGAVDARGVPTSPDPISDVEATLDQIEKQVDQDGTG